MHPFVTGAAAAVAASPSCAVRRGARVTRIVDHANSASGGKQGRVFEVEVEGKEGGVYQADAVIVAGCLPAAAAGWPAPSYFVTLLQCRSESCMPTA
jgi:hypothetical protein